MIWLLSNLWWLVPVLLVLVAAVAVFAGPGLPVVLALLRRVPWQAWALLGAVALLGATFQAGRHYERGVLAEAEKKAEASADARAAKASAAATAKVEAARATISKETADAAAEVRVILRDRACPAVPDRVHELGREAVERARRELPAG